MSQTRLARHNHYKNWMPPTSLPRSAYPAEDALSTAFEGVTTSLFSPYQFKYTTNNRYHYYLTFLIESLDLFPTHLDLAFDSCWRAFEAVCRDDVAYTLGKSVKQLTPFIARAISTNSTYQPCLGQLLSYIPVQACEYLAKRIYTDWPPDGDDSKNSTLIMKRVGFGPGNPPIPNYPASVGLLKEIAIKYAAPALNADSIRRIATLLKKALNGDALIVGTQSCSLSLEERTALLIGALLYTFRNDRFHANIQPPFKSSTGTLQTYAHVHYCFIACHMLVLFGLSEAGIITRDDAAICDNTIDNLTAYRDFYRRHLVK